MTRPDHRRRPLAAALAAAVLLLAAATACSKKDVDDDEEAAGPAVEAGGEVEGCGEGSWTDPEDLEPDREPARCEPGAPAPDPLPEETDVVITSGTLAAEFVAPIQVAIDRGEFEAENLNVTLRQVPPSDSLQLLGQGEVDAVWSAPEAGFVNGVDSGFDLRWVAGNYSTPPESRSGLWVHGEQGEEPDLSELEGRTLASIVGRGSVALYPVEQALDEVGLSLSDLDFRTLPAGDIVTAFENGQVDAVWLLDPLWTQLEDDPDAVWVAGQPPGEPLGGLIYGPNLLRDRPEVGEAFMRAYVRTINTYFAGDYKSDPEFVQYLAELIELDPALLESTPSLTMDWEIRAGSTDRFQEVFIENDAVRIDEPLPEDELVDRSFYEAVVGHTG
ncbi:MAG TPA: ABC transporter substrate-binding protein [Acidimicrobiales bacterium]